MGGQPLPAALAADDIKTVVVVGWVERVDRRGTEPFELFRSEFGQNSWNRKKTTKNYFIEVACDQKYKTGPQKNQEKGNKLL